MFHHFLTALAVTGTALALTSCGMISEKITSEDAMLDKAETATGIAKSSLSLVDGSVDSGLDAVNFSVTDTQGNLYKCYFTSAIAITSDAICTKINKDGTSEPANQGNCNALLKAAGKC